jgi:NADPH:quinone reductase-like Zn-dependent oxidoreductase
MKAAVCTRYGPPDVLQVRHMAMPVAHGSEILIKVHATTVTTSDCFVRSAVPFAPIASQILLRLVLGIRKPRRAILGIVLAGEVSQFGAAATCFNIGDRVYAFTKLRFDAYAEYAALPQSGVIALAPRNTAYDEAAAIPYGGLIALHFLKKGGIRKGQRVLVYGASGAVGTSAVQLAKHFGAEVTAICGPTNMELVQSLGADVAVDYTKPDTTIAGAQYDLILDAVGKRKTSALKVACAAALASEGKYISVDAGAPKITAGDLTFLTALAEAHELKPVIDKRYPLEQIVAAHAYVERGHKRGNVIVNVAQSA